MAEIGKKVKQLKAEMAVDNSIIIRTYTCHGCQRVTEVYLNVRISMMTGNLDCTKCGVSMAYATDAVRGINGCVVIEDERDG